MTDAEINKAVAEAAGWTDLHMPFGVAYVGRHPNGTGALAVPDYANSLDAIVPVVREWCAKKPGRSWDIGDGLRSNMCEAVLFPGDGNAWVKKHRNPARALCLAFLQAVKEKP